MRKTSPGWWRGPYPTSRRGFGVGEPRVTRGFLQRLEAHDWPGNVRELLHALERALILAPGPVLDEAAADLALALAAGGSAQDAPAPPLPGCSGDEARRIAEVLRATGGNISRSARRLGLARSTLRGRIHRHGLGHLVPAD